MLVLSHLVAGAAAGAVTGRHGRAIPAGLVSHAVLDGIGHDDAAFSFAAQAALGAAGLVALVAAWGPSSPVVWGGMAGAAPDAEIALQRLRLRPGARLLYPSHWSRAGRAGMHPYRFAGPAIPARIELVVSVAACALLVAAGRRRRVAG